jgi:glycosyltransferase involved in cell wall biosynthesis
VATVRCIIGLAEAGARVTVLSMKTEKHRSGADTSGERKPDILNEYRTVSVNTAVRPLSLLLNLVFSRKPFDLERFKSREYSSALREILTAGSFDIIHCEGLVFALYLEEIRKLTAAPVILRAHNLEHRIRGMMASKERSTLRRSYLANLSRRLRRLEIHAAEQFDAIVPINGPDSDWFSSAAEGKPVFLSPTGAVEVSYIPEPADAPPRVGFLGSMNWQPNLEGLRWFIESVWPLVLNEIPAARLHLAGRGLSEVRASLPAGRNISFEGEPDDARSFIASNLVMIAPLFAGSGLRIKIIEAMSAGRPMVATTVAAEGIDAAAEYGLTVASDAGAFWAALVKYLENPELRSTAGKAAVRLVRERYDNRTLTAGLLEFYRRIAHDS